MRKLQDRSNNFAEMGRLEKAMRLAGTIRRNYGPITNEVLDALWTQSSEWWASLAKGAEVASPPSAACIESVVGLLSQEVGSRNQHPEDPLEGLPKP